MRVNAAMPLDVRKWLCPSVKAIDQTRGYAAKSGRSPKKIKSHAGGAQPPPHIGRQAAIPRRVATG